MFNRINLDQHKALTPRLRFADGDAAAAGTPEAAAQAAAATAAAAQTATDTAAAAAPVVWDGKIESLDPAAQKIIADLRTEAANNRVKATSAETRTAAILAAAGIGPDAADPVEVAKTATATAAKATRELAVFKAAAAAGADPTKLLDRASFNTSIDGIDPTDGDAIRAAITAAVAADATLKTARAAGASSVDTSGGTGEPAQITDEQLKSMSAEAIVAAQKAGRLKNLLGG
jgi:hypothetical protein